MGQGHQQWCNCGGKPTDAPIQVIQEQGLSERGGSAPSGEVPLYKVDDVNPQQVMAYSPKAHPQHIIQSQLGNSEPTAEPEPAPPDIQMVLDTQSALSPVPENFVAASPDFRQVPLAEAPLPREASDPFCTLESLPADPFATQEFEEKTKKVKNSSAKQLVKDFVKTMVRGRQFAAVLPTGQVRMCFCALNRGLDKLQIRAKESDRHGRTVPLQNIAEIVVGADRGASAATQDLETPLDERSVTLVLETDECITFRMEDTESRDKLAACLTMFSGQARTAGRKASS